MQSAQNRGFGRLTIGLMMALGTLGQLAMNVLLPSLPAIGEAFQTPPGTERLVLTVFLIGFAGGHLIVGPMSDRFGRRAVLIPCLAIYALFGALTLVAPNLEWLLCARALQGIGAASGYVIARAIARDAFDGPALFRVFGLLTLGMGIVPGLAPIIGGTLQDSFGWLASAAVSAILGIVMTVMCWIYVPETGDDQRPSLSITRVAETYWGIFVDATYFRYSMTNALALGSLYAYHTGAPEFFIVQSGLSPRTFGWLTGLHSIFFVIGAWASPRIGGVDEPQRKMTIGILVLLALTLICFGIGVSGHASVLSVLGFIIPFNFTLGIVLSTGIAAALSPFRKRAATATALLGACQMTAGAAASAAVAAMPDQPAIAFPAIMAMMLFTGFLIVRR